MTGLGKPFRILYKKIDSKNQSENAACKQKKPLAKKWIFVHTPFSRST